MVINIRFIELLIKILEKDFLDETLYNQFIKTKGIKGFLNHQNSFGKIIERDYIKEELIKVIDDKHYEDVYEFYKLKDNIVQLKSDIQFINENNDLIIKTVLKEVYKIVPKEIPFKSKIYLYCGGIDGGFTINRKDIFINYGKYIGEGEEFIKVLIHEMYHSRKLPIENRIIFLFKLITRKNRLLYETIGKTIEEGIACLAQHGPNLKKDDLTGNLTKRQLLLAKEQFELINDILINIKSGKTCKKGKKHLNIYVIGYLIVSAIYKEKGVFILDDWTLDLNFRRIIKEYVELCNGNGIPPGFTDEVVEWLIK
ncbi:DUF5700 domain-containing putative Zn-dependent protease [Clostridium sp. Cult2]|uniref:DUF5700 domain-containing putative Zn-dependent protease n=1 Tax=Clostridium sp. Cult2 TaxID=2079003 RepID=UPI001F43C4FB|nr:hypothetical protein [Clostridium sp. Cult2]